MVLSCLEVVRRKLYGTLDDAARATGIPRSTQARAEAGQSVGPLTREKIERAFSDRLEALQQPFLVELQ